MPQHPSVVSVKPGVVSVESRLLGLIETKRKLVGVEVQLVGGLESPSFLTTTEVFFTLFTSFGENFVDLFLF